MIVLVTDNLRKFDELSRIFARYNLPLTRRSRLDFDESLVSEMFAENDKLRAVLDETSQLIGAGHSTHLVSWRDESHHLESVVNRGVLRAWVTKDDRICEQLYTQEITGWLDHTRYQSALNGADVDEVFDWDSLFVVASTGLTYDQMRRRGFKNSVRDLVSSDFLVANLYFDERVDLRWSPRHPERAVDFGLSVGKFLGEHPHIDRDALGPVGVTALLDNVVADGVFFRAAENRRQRNYWAPGLNGGIPLTPKRDAIHEITFMVHDLMHQAVPDLVFSGIPDGSDKAHWRNVYSVWRMISEAFTIVIADMIYVDVLQKNGTAYDFTKRKIWPLFDHMSVGLGSSENLAESLRTLLYANVRYAVLGDDSGLRALRSSERKAEDFEAALAAYRDKYDGYFRADWRWTVDNFDAMSDRSPVFSRWRQLAGDELFAQCRLKLLDDVAGHCLREQGPALETLEGVVDAVFEVAFAQLSERLTPPPPAPVDSPTIKAAQRFMCGQLLLFAAWDFLPKSAALGKSISATLKGPMSIETIGRLEQRFSAHLDDMLASKLISEDDRRTWLGAHPLFDPSYVSYSRGSSDSSLADVARSCFAVPEKDAKPVALGEENGAKLVELGAAWNHIAGLEPKTRLAALLEAVGVSFHDDEKTLVRSPVVAVCGIGGLPVCKGPNDTWLVGASDGGIALADAVAAQRAMMAFAANMSYLNPRDTDPTAMYEAVIRRRHFSIAHTATINVLFAGHSSAVEHELACQRDILHLARVTVARTSAQSAPPIVVANPELADVVSRVRRATVEAIEAIEAIDQDMRSNRAPSLDFSESVNMLFPAAKASAVLVSGSLRNFQKLLGAVDDEGKETEFRALLRSLQSSLRALWPRLF